MNKEDFKNIIEPVVKRNNCKLWGIEILRGKKRIKLRVYIDSNKDIDITDCENVSKDLNYEPSLDMNLGNDYILEVSTPGIDRKFFNISQLKDFIGNELEFKTKEIINGTRKFNGKLILEIGYDQKYKVISFLKEKNFFINKIVKDYGNNHRCIVSTKIN